jgi:hypothetical protein
VIIDFYFEYIARIGIEGIERGEFFPEGQKITMEYKILKM